MTTVRSIARAISRGNSTQPKVRTQNPHRMTGRTYVASPISTYETPRYDATLHRLRTLLPNAELLPARDLFTSNQDWRDHWPELLPTLKAIVFFDDGGSIGRGVWQEIHDAQSAGLPVFYLPHPAANLLPLDGVTVSLIAHRRSWARYAEVVYRLTPEMLAAFGAPEDVVTGFAAIIAEKGGT